MKRIRLNTLFSICLLLLISLSFVTLYINSYWNYKSFKKLTIKALTLNIKKTVEVSFREEVKEEANAFNHQLKDALDIAKNIATQISVIDNTHFDKKSNNIELQYDKFYGYFKYQNNSFLTIHKKEPSGFIAAAKGQNDTVPQKTKTKINKLATLKPIMKRIALTDGNSISSVAIFSKENIVVSYCASPSNTFEAIKYDKLLDFNNLVKRLKFIKKNKSPGFECRRSTLGKNLSLIHLYYPIYGKNGNIKEIITLILRYNWMSKELKKTFMKNYKEYKPITAILNHNDQITYLSEKGYELLSIPISKKILKPKRNSKSTLLLTNSTDPKVKKLANIFSSKQSGKEYITIKGNKYLVLFNNIPIGDWTLAIFVKAESLYKPVANIENKFEFLFNRMHRKYILNFILISIFGFIISYILLKLLLIKPIEALGTQVIKIGNGNFNLKVKETGTREIYELSKTFNNLGGKLAEYTNNLKKEIITRQSIETELQIAGDLQQSVLPKITSEFRNNSFELFAKLIPAKEMSGDFYDFFYLNEETLVLVLADVSGKGITAAFYMSMAKAIIRETCLANRSFTPGQIFEKVNWVLNKDNDTCMFLTAYLIFYNIKTGKIHFTNAGHHELLCISSQQKIEAIGILNNIALGTHPTIKYSTSEIQLEKNQCILLFTDGIIEAPDEHGNEYGLNRLINLVNKSNDEGNIEKIGNIIAEDALNFEKGKRFDDITLLVIKRTK